MNPQIEMPAAIAALPRQQRRYWLRQKVKADRLQHTIRFTQSRQNRRDLLAQFMEGARAMLMSSDTATPPKYRAVRKMVRYLLASPLHKFTMRHQRGSWRSWPRNIGADELKKLTAEA